MKRSDNEIIVNITTKVKEKLNFNKIANNHDEIIFNPEKFPGLIIQSDIPKATIVLYSTQNIFIAGLHHRYEVDQVVEKLSTLLREEGIEFKDPEIYIENLKPIMLKICILGNKGVGKSTLINTILENSDEKHIQSKPDKIGVNFAEVETRDLVGRKVILQLWNIIDDDKFKGMERYYLKGAKAGIIVYDITDKSSFKRVEHYLSIFRKLKKNRDLPIVLIGNKIDMNYEREVMKSESSVLVLKHKLTGYIECSATDIKSIKKAFKSITQMIFRGDQLVSISNVLKNELNLKILINLQIFKELSLSELSKHIHKSKATLSRHTRQLIKLGLIEANIKDENVQAGKIDKKHYNLNKDLKYQINKPTFNFKNLNSYKNWEWFTEFYFKKQYTFNLLELLSKKLNEMLSDLSKKIFTGEPPLINQFGKYLEFLPINIQYLNESQNEKVQALILDFNSKLNEILKEDDSSKKPYLLANMTFPVFDIINLFDNPFKFNQLILKRELKKFLKE